QILYRTTKLGGPAVLGNGCFVVSNTECRTKHPQTCSPTRLFTRLKEMGNYHSVYISSRGMAPPAFPNSILHRLSLCRKPPNAGAHLLPEAGAQRTLEAVRCSARLCQNPLLKVVLCFRHPLACTGTLPRPS